MPVHPGWAGYLAPDELAYIRERLRADPDLRYAWGFQRRRRTFPARLIQEIALHGDPEGRQANIEIVRAWRAGRRAARARQPVDIVRPTHPKAQRVTFATDRARRGLVKRAP